MLDWKLCDFKGIRTSIVKEPYIFIFQGGGGGGGLDPLSLPPLYPHMYKASKVLKQKREQTAIDMNCGEILSVS